MKVFKKSIWDFRAIFKKCISNDEKCWSDSNAERFFFFFLHDQIVKVCKIASKHGIISHSGFSIFHNPRWLHNLPHAQPLNWESVLSTSQLIRFQFHPVSRGEYLDETAILYRVARWTKWGRWLSGAPRFARDTFSVCFCRAERYHGTLKRLDRYPGGVRRRGNEVSITGA